MIKKQIVVLTLVIVLTLAFACSASAVEDDESSTFEDETFLTDTITPSEDGEFQELMVKGKILRVLSQEQIFDEMTQEPGVVQRLEVRVTSGKFKGKLLQITNYPTNNPVYDIRVKPGDRVVIYLELLDGEIKEAHIADFLRELSIYALAILFILLLLAIGWRKGAKALCSLLITMLLIWGLLLPGILRGYSPVFLTLVIAGIATAITLLVVGGATRKSFAAILGTMGGVAVSGILALIVGKAAHLTGFGTEEAGMLLYIPQNIKLDIQGLLFAGIIIGALGAAMDVSMSIASAIEEVKRVNPLLGTKELMNSGMNVGRDIMGTMSNTLILAYTGSSIQLILVIMAYQTSIMKIINLDMIASEIVRALIGSIGMILVIPLTTAIAGAVFGRQKASDTTDA